MTSPELMRCIGVICLRRAMLGFGASEGVTRVRCKRELDENRFQSGLGAEDNMRRPRGFGGRCSGFCGVKNVDGPRLLQPYILPGMFQPC